MNRYNSSLFGMIYHLVYNPMCRSGSHSYHVVETLIDYAIKKGIKIIVHETKYKRHAIEITRKLTTNVETEVRIISFGGDGTLHEVLNGIVDFKKTTIAILPLGSGNDFARYWGIDLNDQPIVMLDKIITQYVPKKIDYLLINDSLRVINSVNLGMSARVIKFMEKLRYFKPRLKYLIATFCKCVFYKNFNYLVSFNKKPFIKIVSPSITFCNGPYFGCGMLIAPGAEANDGIIKTSIIHKFNRLVTLKILMRLKKNKINLEKYYQAVDTKEADVILAKSDIQADGQLFFDYDHLNIKIVTKKLTMLLPPK